MAQLDQQRERIQDDLRGLIAGDVRCDDVFLQLYSADASIYSIRPLGVVRPRSTADVSACLEHATEKQMPVHARGAGSSTAGAALGPGLVIDFSKYLRRVIVTEAETVRVQPGLVHERLNAHLRRHDRLFGPSAVNSVVTTIGGMLAVDMAGSHWLKYGSPHNHVLALQVVLADGQVLSVGREPIHQGTSRDPDPTKRALVNRLWRLLSDNSELIRRSRTKCPADRSGYNVAEAFSDEHLDLARLLVGSEGTLALVTEALLATQPEPKGRAAALLLFDRLETASRAVQTILAHRPSACDLMDRRHLSLARETEVQFDLLVPQQTEAVLLVEQEGDDPVEVRSRLHGLVDEVWHQRHLAFGARQAFDASELELFRQLAYKIQPVLYRMKGSMRPIPVVEDMAVPPECLPDFLIQMQNVLKRHEVTASLFCHAGQGHVHIEPFLDLAERRDVEKMRRLADDLYQEVFAAGGTTGTERASGLSRTPYLERQHGELYELFRQIKQVFDPEGVLNPGKVVGDQGTLPTQHLRPMIAPEQAVEAEEDGDKTPQPRLRDLLELQLNWDPSQVSEVARACNGCGECRSQASDVRMCPIFRILPAEEASPRAKANLICGVLTRRLELESVSSDEFKDIADLCVHCHMCALECPAKVDIPKLMLEGKGAHVAANGLKTGDWVMTHLDWLSRLAGRVSPLANWAVGNRQMRWLMEKTLGVAQGRKLPRVASRSFVRRAARRRLTKPNRRSGKKVAYFVDTYANYHDTQLAEALVAVMEHNGVSVYVPPEQKEAGMAAVACGALDVARRLAQHNAAVFAEAVRQGYDVVATEPAVAVCLTREYLDLLDDDDARLVADNTVDACSYLWKMHTTGKLQLDLKPINAALGYHMPCRLKALDVGSPGENLLSLIPGLSVEHCEEGCSGMAGTFGMKRENYRTSLRAGWGLISRLRDPHLQAGTTECSTCKIQMEQGTTKPTIHPIKLFAHAYGLLPDGDSLLTVSGEELVVT